MRLVSHAYNFSYTVPDLPVCEAQRGVPQCCSTLYIQQRQQTIKNQLVEGLRTDMMERFMQFNSVVDGMRQCKFFEIC